MPHFISNNLETLNTELIKLLLGPKTPLQVSGVTTGDFNKLIATIQILASHAMPSGEQQLLGSNLRKLADRVARDFIQEGGNKIAQELRHAANTVMRAAALPTPPPPAAAGAPLSTLTTAAASEPVTAKKAEKASMQPLPSAEDDAEPQTDDLRFESVVYLNQWLAEVNRGDKILQEAGLTEAALKAMIAKIQNMDPMPLTLPLYGQMLSQNLCSLAAHVDFEFRNKELVVDLLALATGSKPEEIARNYENSQKPPRGVPRLFNNFVNLTDGQLAKLAEDCPDLTELVIDSKLLTQAAAKHIERFTKLQKLVINGTALTSLNLAKCPQLQILHINGCEALDELNLENCHNLTEVRLSCTGLKMLKFSESPHALKTVYLFGNQTLQEVQLPTQANALEFFALIGPTTRIDMPVVASKLHSILCINTHITELTLPINAHHISSIDVQNNRLLAKIEWPSKDRSRRVPCLDDLDKFNCSLTKLQDLSALTKAINLRLLEVDGCEKIAALDLSQSSTLEYAEFIDCAKLASVKLPPSAPSLRMVKICLSPLLNPETVTPFEGHKAKVVFEKHDRDEIIAQQASQE